MGFVFFVRAQWRSFYKPQLKLLFDLGLSFFLHTIIGFQYLVCITSNAVFSSTLPPLVSLTTTISPHIPSTRSFKKPSNLSGYRKRLILELPVFPPQLLGDQLNIINFTSSTRLQIIDLLFLSICKTTLLVYWYLLQFLLV